VGWTLPAAAPPARLFGATSLGEQLLHEIGGARSGIRTCEPQGRGSHRRDAMGFAAAVPMASTPADAPNVMPAPTSARWLALSGCSRPCCRQAMGTPKASAALTVESPP
jgi:hypothetical protein